MHTHKPGLECYWEIPISDKNYVSVFVWANMKVMHFIDPRKRKKIGYCITIPWIEHKDTKQRKCGKKFAELHFVRDHISAGLVAHELCHLTNYWVRFNWWIPERDDEKIATFNERVTRSFWKEFYKRYIVNEKGYTIGENVVK